LAVGAVEAVEAVEADEADEVDEVDNALGANKRESGQGPHLGGYNNCLASR
jgi:hypothetical protein